MIEPIEKYYSIMNQQLKKQIHLILLIYQQYDVELKQIKLIKNNILFIFTYLLVHVLDKMRIQNQLHPMPYLLWLFLH
jgi:hypothetical protein